MNPQAHKLMGSYLAAVEARLAGPARVRRAILDELADGIEEAISAGMSRGLDPIQASRAATVEFGDPVTVASAFGEELAIAQARRVSLGIVRTGPIVGLAWLAAILPSLAAGEGVPAQALWDRLRGGLVGAHVVLPVVGLAVAIAGLATLTVVLATGPATRWLQTGSSFALGGAVAACFAATVCDLSLFAVLATQTLTAPGALVWAPTSVAIAAGITRLVLSARAARRCLAIRARLA